MKILDIIRLAFKNLFRRKGRTALTVLGIMIGATSVIIMISIGLGLDESKQKLLSQFNDLEIITVYRQWGGNEGQDGQTTKIGILNDKAIAEFNKINKVVISTPQMNFWDGKLVSGKLQTQWVQILGMYAEAMPYFEAYKLASGRLLSTDLTADSKELEVVVGYEVPFDFYNPKKDVNKWGWFDKEYYSGVGEDTRISKFDPLNDSLKITFDWSYGEKPYIDPENTEIGPIKKSKLYELKVVGTLAYDQNGSSNNYLIMDIAQLRKLQELRDKENGNNQSGGLSYSSIVMVGGSSSYDLKDVNANEQQYDNVVVRCKNMKDVETVSAVIQEMGFQTNSYMSYIKPMQDKMESDQFLFLAIGVIAFIVAALNIINTMLMSTYERTREIGIMKVLGCKISNIRDLFLLEAALLGVVGGVLAVPVSLGISFIINYMQGGGLQPDQWGWYDPYAAMSAGSSIIPIWLCAAAVVFSALVGFVSGLYPSIRAMNLSALDSIKNE